MPMLNFGKLSQIQRLKLYRVNFNTGTTYMTTTESVQMVPHKLDYYYYYYCYYIGHNYAIIN